MKDESDKYIVGSAVKSDCDLLVTGDKGIQDCEIEDVNIVDARELLDSLN